VQHQASKGHGYVAVASKRAQRRKIILRLRFPDNAEKLPGHFNQARVLKQNYRLDSM
jgi:hypothetical protein